ncbi:MAG TPA: tetratricopeptide repeat protein [Terriglobales bacterium]|nr:tetratricopeptide repeat protein [Terriglobales bacterium]
MNKFLFGLALTFLVPVVSAPAWAGFQEGADAYNKGDYQTALGEWMPLAQSGNAQAQNAVGALYDNGLGVASDEAEAFRWYSMAANQNYPMAMRNLGTMYATGHGVPYNLPQAQLWLGRAASAGDSVAAKRLAGLPPVATLSAEPVATPLSSDSSAVGNMLPAATPNSNFGAATGPSNFVTAPAAAAPASAATASNTTAGNAAGSTTATATQPATGASGLTFPAPAPATQDGSAAVQTASATPTTAPASTTVATTAAVDATASASTAASAAAGAAPGGTAADGWHAFDIGDYKTALQIWEPLAQQGDANLQVLVGSLYDYGQGVPQDKKQALQWYVMAAEKGLGRAQLAAGSLLAKNGKQQDLVEGYKWLTIAGDTLRGQGGDVAASQALNLRKQIAKSMSEADIAKAESLAQGFHAS